MPTAIQIKNPANNHLLRCNMDRPKVFVELIVGPLPEGLALPAEALLERTPAADLFTRMACADGFKKEHIAIIEQNLRSNPKI